MKNFLEGFEYEWDLVHETLCEQVFIVEIDSKEELRAKVDIFYKRPKEVEVSVFIMGNQLIPTDELFFWLSFDLEKIIERRCHYYVLKYFLCGKDRRLYQGFLRKIKERRFDSQNP
jgi:hypothetical protein